MLKPKNIISILKLENFVIEKSKKLIDIFEKLLLSITRKFFQVGTSS